MAREMRDSGIEWIGEIPFNWIVRRLRYMCNIVTGNQDTQDNDPDGQYPFYVRSPIVEKSNKYTFEGPAILMSGDGAGAGRIFHMVDGKYGCHQRVYSIQDISGIDRRLLYHYMSNLFWIMIETANSKSTVDSVRLNMLQDFPVLVPPEEEQEKISRCLNDAVPRVDNVISKTHASIEEYKKLKQAIITQAVTKGIRCNREMKDSQSIWFGQIPSDWGMRKIKYIFKIQKDIAGEEGHTVLSITQKGIKPKDLSKNEGQLAENYSNYQLVHIGDFAMNHMDLLTGWVDVSKYEGVTSPDYRVFGLIDKDNYCSQYYLYLMQMCYTNRIFYGLGQGVSGLGRWRLQADKFLNFSITVPSYEEQKEIANYLDQKCSAIDELIAKKEQYLSEIENYKNSLIYEYVTGKKEV
ncbi:MAG: restriction endonuclease subunit S [Lachnospiraceae bacterium]|nr:restriction endonuclease subunit S [Lachnospiraceae bacterium]